MYQLAKDNKYDLLKPWTTLDEWQKEYIESEGNCALLSGRQCGKTVAMSIKMAELALKGKAGEDVLCVAFTERQAYHIFSKCLSYLLMEYPEQIRRGRYKPTMHIIHLKNGVKIRCEPTGKTGEGLRGFTFKKIFVDEARMISDEVFTAVMPMLSVIKGTMDISSTPCGKQGFFWKVFNPDDASSKDFKHFKVSAEDCPRHKKEFLDYQKAVMSAKEYAQEYLAQFLDELRRYFSDELIFKCCNLKRRENLIPERRYYLGVDIARMGEDETTFEILDRREKIIEHVENIITKKTLTTETQERIIDLEKKWNFHYQESIGIDAGSGSLGVGVYDNLLKEPVVRRKIVAINNRKLVTNEDKREKQKLLKEDLYDNLRGLMERGEIFLLDDDSVIESLKSIQYEHIVRAGRPTRMYIFGNYTHIAEGLIRAAWLCSRKKSLSIKIDYI